MSAAELSTPADTDEKAFATFRAAAAFKGYTLARSNPSDGPVSYFAQRWGYVAELRTLADVARFVDRIGGPGA